MFAHHVVVADDIYRRRRGNDGYPVEHLAVELYPLDLDYTLFTATAAGKIITYGYAVCHILDTKDMGNTKQCIRWYMVNYRAGLQGGYSKTCFLFAHDFKGSMPKAFVMIA